MPSAAALPCLVRARPQRLTCLFTAVVSVYAGGCRRGQLAGGDKGGGWQPDIIKCTRVDAFLSHRIAAVGS